jgi:cysteine-rich repeat protein
MVALACALAATIAASDAANAATAEQKCEGGKNLASGKYAACMHKARQKFVLGGESDSAAYDQAVLACGTKYSGKFAKSDSLGTCTGAETEVQAFVDACVASVVSALDGGTLGLDPSECNAALDSCETSFDDCTMDLAACEAMATCGDGVIEGSEQCDDGNGNDLDACRNNCQLPRCGDGVASASEACDSGGNTSTCDFNCSNPACGDGLVNGAFTPSLAPGPERCDDGNTSPGDGCSASCQVEDCGNGVTEFANGEQCDDGNGNDLDACRNNCQSPRCGDGVASASEACDTGTNTATCDHDCTMPACNDGVVNLNANEQCEDGNLVAGDGCSNLCRLD